MKNMYKAFGIIIMAVIIVLLAVGCGGTGNGNPGTDNIAPPTSGKLTITGLEDYNGAYIIPLKIIMIKMILINFD